jgi:hypothetical protein
MLHFLSTIPLLAERALSIAYKYQSFDLEKYPLIFRPIINFLTLSFFTSSGVKIYPVYIFYFVVALYIIINIIFARIRLFVNQFGVERYTLVYRDAQINFMSYVSLVVVVTFLLPDYANAKYTIFALPFVYAYVVGCFFRISHFSFSLVLLNFAVILNLIWLRV